MRWSHLPRQPSTPCTGPPRFATENQRLSALPERVWGISIGGAAERTVALGAHVEADGRRPRQPQCERLPTAARAEEQFVEWLTVFGGQEARGRTVRYAHMATLGRLTNGSLVAAWQASTQYEGADDQQVRTRRRRA